MGYGSDYVDELHDDLEAAKATIASLRAEVDRLTQALAEARNEALEEAARVADGVAAAYRLVERLVEREPELSIGCAVVAKEIRALQEPAHE